MDCVSTEPFYARRPEAVAALLLNGAGLFIWRKSLCEIALQRELIVSPLGSLYHSITWSGGWGRFGNLSDVE